MYVFRGGFQLAWIFFSRLLVLEFFAEFFFAFLFARIVPFPITFLIIPPVCIFVSLKKEECIAWFFVFEPCSHSCRCRLDIVTLSSKLLRQPINLII